MSKNNLWVERYRPRLADDYVFTDDNLRQQVNHWIKDQSFPHLLLHGPAGTGKTTLAKILIHNVGIDDIDVMYTNGSKEGRYINWVDKLIGFVQTMPFGPFKVVLVDEADYLNKESVQPAMRNLMEDYSESVRFILTCNYPSKIIPPLKSRCHEIKINRTDQTEFTARAATILVNENIDFDLETLDSYVRATYPDLRKCINLLQPNSVSGKLMSVGDQSTGTEDFMLKAVDLFKSNRYRQGRQVICDNARPEEMEDIFRWCYNNLSVWSGSESGQDQALVIIRHGLVNHTSCADPEINIAATLIELSNITE